MSDGFQSCKSNDKHSSNSELSIGIQFLSVTARLLFEFTYYGSASLQWTPILQVHRKMMQIEYGNSIAVYVDLD